MFKCFSARVFKLFIFISTLTICSTAFAQSLIRGPYLQTGTPDSMTIKWRTSAPTVGKVWYGTNPFNLNQTVSASVSTTDQNILINNLQPGTRYYYAVGYNSTQLAGADNTTYFVTSPDHGTVQPVRIWAIGDSGTANQNALAVKNSFLNFNNNKHVDVWLMLGDNAYSDGTDSEYQAAVFDTYPEILKNTVLWPTIGNHDANSNFASPYKSIFTLPKYAQAGGVPSGTERYYSYDYANIHFICLDSSIDIGLPGTPQMTWLEEDLAATTQKWIVAYFHHPPYSKGSHDSDLDPTLWRTREIFLPILESGGVDLVLSGPSHSYERSHFIDGHYGFSWTFNSSSVIDGGDGRVYGDGVYQKNLGPHNGAVYTVAGSSGKTSGGSLNHPVMFSSLNELGSVVLDVLDDQLDAYFINDQGQIRDYYSIVKNGNNSVPPPPPINGSVSIRVADKNDDAEENVITDLMYLDSSDLEMTADGAFIQQVGMRFRDVQIPQGANIVSAYVQFTTDETSSNSTLLNIRGEARDNAPGFRLSTENISNRAATNASVSWSVPAWNSAGASGSAQRTPDLSSVIQEIIDRPGWEPSHSLVLMVTGNGSRIAEAYEGSPTKAPVLNIVYDAQSTSTFQRRVSSSSDDAEEQWWGSVSRNSSDLELVLDGSNQTVGIRIQNVTVPQGATIQNAYLQFKADESDYLPGALNIYGEDKDNASYYRSSYKNISRRARTSAVVGWIPPSWNTGEAGPKQRTPDLKTVVQEIVNRSGWRSGNAMAFTIRGSGEWVAESYNGDPNGAPLLVIDYLP